MEVSVFLELVYQGGEEPSSNHIQDEYGDDFRGESFDYRDDSKIQMAMEHT